MAESPDIPPKSPPPKDLPRDPSETYNPAKTTVINSQPDVPVADLRKTLPLWETAKATPGESSGPVPRPSHRRDYVLRELIGKGGFGEVWEALQVSLGRVIAVKRMKHQFDDEPHSTRYLERLEFSFHQEALTTGSLEHPNIVPVYDLGRDEQGRPLLAMKRVRGKPWDELIDDDRAMAPADFLGKHLPILANVAQAVAYAHSRGIVHRDLKPSQVMVGEFGEVLLMDWGLALVFDTDRATAELPPMREAGWIQTTKTAPNPAGTAAFMAPEQTEDNASRIGPWTDVFLLGSTLYYLLTLSPPYSGDDPNSVYFRAMSTEFELPELRSPEREVPAELSAIVLRAMAADPDDRFASAKELLAAVQDFLTGAGKRRESRALIDQVAERLGAEGLGYAELAECDNLLLRARELWPENPDAEPLRERVLSSYASTALANGDLKLAQLQAERIARSQARKPLLERVIAAQASVRRRDHQRRLAIAATLILLFIVGFAGFALRESRLRAENESARRLLDQEQAARAQERALQEAQLKRFFEKVNLLRTRENALAAELAHDIPLPESLHPMEGTQSNTVRDEAKIAALLARLDELRRERASLEAQVPEATLESPPFPLLLAEANLLLARAVTGGDSMRAHDLYDRAREERSDLPEPWTGMAVAAFRAGHPTSATLYLAEASARIRRLRGENHADYARALALEGEAQKELNSEDQDYIQYYRRSLEILQPQWADLSLTLAERAQELGMYQEAAAYSSPTLELNRRFFGERDRRTAEAYETLGTSLFLSGELSAAEQAMRRALDLRSDILGLQHEETAESFEDLAVVLADRGRNDEALELMGEALAIRRAIHGEEHPETAIAYHTLATLMARAGRFAEGEEYARSALRIDREVLGPEHPRTARDADALAVLLQYQGRFPEAQEYLELAMRVRLEKLGEHHPATATSYQNVASNLTRLGDIERAEQLSRKALRIRREVFGPRSLETATILSNLGSLLESQGRLGEAEQALLEAISITEESQGPESPQLAIALNNLARVLEKQKRAGEALPVARRALLLQRSHWGDAHPMTGVCFGNLARMMALQGRYDDAELLQRKAGTIFLETMGPGNPYLAILEHRWVWLLTRRAETGSSVEACRLIAKADALRQAAWQQETLTLEDIEEDLLAGTRGVIAGLLVLEPPRLDMARREFQRALPLARMLGKEEDGDLATEFLRPTGDRLGVDFSLQADEAAPRPTEGAVSAADIAAYLAQFGPPVDWEEELPEVPAWEPAPPSLQGEDFEQAIEQILRIE